MASKIFGLIEVSGIADVFPINPPFFKQLSVQETIVIPAVKPDVEQIVSVHAEVVIGETRIIVTPAGQSFEGQVLTNRKLLIEGCIAQKVEYVADEPTQSVHAAHFNAPFSAFIVLPPNIPLDTPVEVTGYIEDIFIQQIDKRSAFKNVTLLLTATI